MSRAEVSWSFRADDGEDATDASWLEIEQKVDVARVEVKHRVSAPRTTYEKKEI